MLNKIKYNQKTINNLTQVIFNQTQNLYFIDRYKNNTDDVIKKKLIAGEPKIMTIGKNINK